MTLRFERAVLAALRHGDEETFELPQEDLPKLEALLREVVLEPRASEELHRALALSVALEEELASPSAAACLRQLLANDAFAVHLIRSRIQKDGFIDEVRTFLRLEDRDDSMAAPAYEDSTDGLRIADLIDPVSRQPRHRRPSNP